MGLDMYLYRKTYVKNWSFMKDEEKHEVQVKVGGAVRQDIDPDKVCCIIEEVAYWRKANAIHKWFVDNVQNGVDDCTPHYVSQVAIKTLVDLCKQVLNSVETVAGTVRIGSIYYADGRIEENTKEGEVVAQAGLASSLLPTESGFYFGSTDYDEGYIQNLKDTVAMLEPYTVASEESSDFEYLASW